MVRGFGGHFCFDFFRLRFFDISKAVLMTTGNELEEEGTTGRGGGGGGTGACSTFFCGCGVGIGGGGGGGDGATTSEVAGDATELSDPGLEATVAGLEEAPAVTLEAAAVPAIPPLLRHPSSDPSWLGDRAPLNLKQGRIRQIQRTRIKRGIALVFTFRTAIVPFGCDVADGMRRSDSRSFTSRSKRNLAFC